MTCSSVLNLIFFTRKAHSFSRQQPIPAMKQSVLLLLGSSIAILFTSCAAGVVDRTEDRYDRREDRVDRRHYDGPGDVIEDRIDRRENVNDKLRGRRGLRY